MEDQNVDMAFIMVEDDIGFKNEEFDLKWARAQGTEDLTEESFTRAEVQA